MVKWPEIKRNGRLPDRERLRVGRELLKEYQAGKSIRQLCMESGYSIGRVRRLLVEAGVSFRTRGGARAS
jgi:hypothetical protein